MARPASDIERVQTGLRLRSVLVKTFKHLAIDTGKPFNQLVEEALDLYLQLQSEAALDPQGKKQPSPPNQPDRVKN